MNLSSSHLEVSNLTEKEFLTYKDLNSERFGLQLSQLIARKLSTTTERSAGINVYGDGLYHSHRDYCGIGIYFIDRAYTIGEVNDGMGPFPIISTFDTEEEFIHWLADQSDQSMSIFTLTSFNNQTITRLRMEYYLEEDYSPIWNDFATYVNNRLIR